MQRQQQEGHAASATAASACRTSDDRLLLLLLLHDSEARWRRTPAGKTCAFTICLSQQGQPQGHDCSTTTYDRATSDPLASLHRAHETRHHAQGHMPSGVDASKSIRALAVSTARSTSHWGSDSVPAPVTDLGSSDCI